MPSFALISKRLKRALNGQHSFLGELQYYLGYCYFQGYGNQQPAQNLGLDETFLIWAREGFFLLLAGTICIFRNGFIGSSYVGKKRLGGCIDIDTDGYDQGFQRQSPDSQILIPDIMLMTDTDWLRIDFYQFSKGSCKRRAIEIQQSVFSTLFWKLWRASSLAE